MTLKSIFNNCIKTFAVAICLMATGSSATAQQQTQQIAPPTRNPQTNVGEVFQQQRSGVQSTGSDQLLKQSSGIEIPEGEPARSDSAEEESAPGRSAWIILTLLGAGLAVVSIFRSRRRWTGSEDVAVSVLAPVGPEAQPSSSASLDAKASLQPKKKNKSNKARKRKKRKRN